MSHKLTYKEWKKTLGIDISDPSVIEILRKSQGLDKKMGIDDILKTIYDNEYLQEENTMT